MAPLKQVPPGGIFAFEAIGDDLPFLPLAARRALDGAGLKLSLGTWRTLAVEQRRALVRLGTGPAVNTEAVQLLLEGVASETIALDDGTRLESLSPQIVDAYGPAMPLNDGIWLALPRLARFALSHLATRDAKRRLAAYRELVGDAQLTHLDASGEAHMVDVGGKAITARRAVAGARVVMSPDAAKTIVEQRGAKGDVLAVARIAGIMAAKRTPELIPLCHGIALHHVAVDLDVDVDAGIVTVRATAEARDRTGVEMEAMVAASVASLTVYDMLKAVDRGIAIEEVVLLEKSGGRSGHYRRGAS